jgi:hypothetical protein
MKPVLILVQPLDPKLQARVDVRLADGPSADTYGTGNVAWAPALRSRPTLSIELMSPDMSGKVQAGTTNFVIALDKIGVARARSLYWKGAPIVIHSTGVLEGPSAVPDFVGYVTASTLDLDSGGCTITAEVSTALIDKDLLTLSFDGGGGLGGDPGIRGTLFPLGMGNNLNIEPVWFDLTRNIGMLDGYGNTTDIWWLAEGLASFGASVGNYANYAALAAAIDAKQVKPGQWATSIVPGQPGLVGLGAPPDGVITCHANFSFGTVGAMMQNILRNAAHANLPAAKVDATAFANLSAAVPYPAHYWTREQRNAKDLLEALAQSCNATPIATFQGMFTVARAIASVPIGTLDRSGSVEPRVLNWQSGTIDAPFYLLKARAARPATVLTFDQVNYNDTIEDKGLFNTGTIYRQGHIVWLRDGSQWLYINAVPSAGHVPPTGAYDVDQWWQNLKPATTAADILYNDGTTLEALKPATPGATAGAPAGTFVGDQEAQDVVIQMGLNGMNALYATALATTQAALLDAVRNLQDGSALTVKIQNLVSQVENPDQNAIQTLNLIGAAQPNGAGGTVFVIGQNTAIGTPEKLIGQTIDTIVSQVAGHEASITSIKEIVTTPNGSSELRALTTLNEDGVITGTINTLTGGRSKYAILADEFRIVSQDNSNLAYTPFSVIDGQVTMLDVVVRKLSYEALVPLFGGAMNQLNPNSGFQIMPGGLIMQWGRFRGTINSEVTFSIVFPMPFPTGVMSTGAMPYLNSFSNVRDLWVQNVGQPTQFGATFATQAATNDDRKLDGFDWWAWGY